jgi:dihydropteroate synthase
VSRRRICIDPGFGFGKYLEHNLSLFKNLESIKERLDMPVLVGVSRKSMIGQLTGKPVEERLAGSVAAALCAAAHGADIVRVHDVAATVDALKVWRALT